MVQETLGFVGNANNPSGWNNNFGRLMGKFGMWPVNQRDYLVSLLSRGTKQQRLASLGRLAITQSAIAGVATAFGVNLSTWYSIPGMFFKGGPGADIAQTAYTAISGSGYEQNNAINRIYDLLPYNFQKGEFQPSILTPYSYAFSDLVGALQESMDNGPEAGAFRLLGIKPQSDKYQPSTFENQIGQLVGAR